MSYFFCVFEPGNKLIKGLENDLSEIAPESIRKDAVRIKGDSYHFASYGNDKAIRNIIISEEREGSWLAILGTPLVGLTSKKGEEAFLTEFLERPTDELRQTIDGNFAILCYDARAGKMLVATDFNCTIPVFYSTKSEGIVFSSHELVLAKFNGSERDPFGFSQAIHLGSTWGSRTRFSDIKKMRACEILTIDKKLKMSIEPYWTPKEEKMWSGTFDSLLEHWMESLKSAVLKFYECADRKRVFADFTAGEDARLILSQCHALGIPFTAQVTGLSYDTDVIVAKEAAKKANFELLVRNKHWISEEELLAHVWDIVVGNDGYQELFKACVEFATNNASPLDDYSIVKYCGLPGGEAFRGSYYLRGKAIFPSRTATLDFRFFTKMKYMLDFHPGLLKYPDHDFMSETFNLVKESVEDVKAFPLGIQIDHLLRAFQTCLLGLKYRNPLYLPFATRELTRSVYYIPPRYKRGGRLTRACTEILFPEVASVKTQKGVPTVRRTFSRFPLFLPEYLALVKGISSGAVGRLLKWRQANKWYYSLDRNAAIFETLLNTAPYRKWLSSSENMLTGEFYNSSAIDPLLAEAKGGTCRYVPVLGRIISQELACRWVFDERDR
jgi:hypothetical protein